MRLLLRYRWEKCWQFKLGCSSSNKERKIGQGDLLEIEVIEGGDYLDVGKYGEVEKEI